MTEVVLIVLDGLRPDMVTSEVMPRLCALTAQGTEFTSARSVFPSVTAVAAASMATGVLPARHGVVGNELLLRGEQGTAARSLRDYRVARGLDQTLDKGLVEVATFGDVMAAAGRRLAIVDAGVPVVSTLLNPRAALHRHWSFSTEGRDCTVTPRAWDEIVKRFGFPPERELPRFDEVRFATDVFIEHVLRELAPDVAVLWLGEPDATSRWREVGGLETENTLRFVDRQVGRVIDAVRRISRGERTTIFVASDHGQLSAMTAIDVVEELRGAGFKIGCGIGAGEAEVVFTGQGYGALTFLSEDHVLEQRAARWLMEQSWVGNVMTRASGEGGLGGRVPGTLGLEICGLAHPRGADLVFTFRHEDGLDRNGVEGRGVHNWAQPGCRGTHGGLSRVEMSTVLFGVGPGFSVGRKCGAVAGLIDLAPSILGRLGLMMPDSQGRDLARMRGEERREIRIEAGEGGYSQAIVVSQSEGARPSLSSRLEYAEH